MARISILLLLLGAIVSLVAASSAPTFCKCTCGKNSTIIPLGPAGQSPESMMSLRSIIFDPERRPHLPTEGKSGSSPNPKKRSITARSKSSSCSECTKAFCLSQGISFCKDVKEEQVTTMCFKRDSNKDKIIVWGFIIGTVGLLGWAALKRLMELRRGHSLGQGTGYAPMQGNFR